MRGLQLAACLTVAAVAGAVTGVTAASDSAAPVHVTPAAHMAPCAMEDSPGPCYWDASTRGNGLGRSFYVDQTGRVFYTDRETSR